MLYLCLLSQSLCFCCALPQTSLHVHVLISTSTQKGSPLFMYFSFNSFGYLGISEFTHSPEGRCLQLNPLQRACKKLQCPRSVQQGPHCVLFIIFGLFPCRSSCRLTDSACCGYVGWMKHPPGKTQGHTHLPVCTYMSVIDKQQAWLPVQASASLLLQNFQFLATLNGRPVSMYLIRPSWSLQQSSILSQQFRGRDCTYWVASSQRDKPKSHTEITQGCSISGTGTWPAPSRFHAGCHAPSACPAIILALAAHLAAHSQKPVTSKRRLLLLLQLPARSWPASTGSVACSHLEVVSTRQFKELNWISK